MSANLIEKIETRDVHSDRSCIEERLEAFRDRQPASNALLKIAPNSLGGGADAAIPEIPANALSLTHLDEALQNHGSLIVRGLFPQETMDSLRATIDAVLDRCEQNATSSPPPPGVYFNPPTNLTNILPNRDRELGNTRSFHRESGSAMCIEAPSVAETLLELYEQTGLKDLIEQYFAEPACLSAKKWVLRRSKLPVAEAGWHQDGAFMGETINSLNLWLPLNTCGAQSGAPGLDVLPQRLSNIASADGAQFDWSVSAAEVSNKAGGQSVQSPEFNAGDAYFFDHYFLHRTQHRLDFTQLRYAIETWFFGASAFPKNQIPLAW